MSVRSLSLVSFVALFGCAPDLSTLARRQDYMHDRIDADLQKVFECSEVSLRFVASERRSGDWYDRYVAEGCDQRSEYVLRLSQSADGKWVTWAFGVVPSESEYHAAAKQQLLASARFDLGCDGPIALVTLKSFVDPMQLGFRGSIGATGCDTRLSYEVVCGHSGYVARRHQIACTTVPNTAARGR
jgi:hypothetical protein